MIHSAWLTRETKFWNELITTHMSLNNCILPKNGRHIGFSGVNMGQIQILTLEMESLPKKTVYNMYYTMIYL